MTVNALSEVKGVHMPAIRDTINQPLTPRQESVMRLYAAGMSRAAIAEALGLKPDSVSRMLSTIRAEMGCATLAEAVEEWLG